MILVPNLLKDALELIAHSYRNRELEIVSLFLSENRFEFSTKQIGRDNHNRKGTMFRMAGLLQIQRFEKSLGIRLRKQDMLTVVDFEGGDGTPYRCMRIGKVAWEKECAEVIANGDHAAFLKCALLANKKNWFGVESELGKCRN